MFVFVLPALASTAAVSAAATSAAAAASTSAIVLAGTGFVDNHISAVILGPVELGDSVISCVFTRHLDKAEAPRTAGLTIHYNVCRVNLACGRKVFLKIFAGDTKRQISHVKFRTHFPLNYRTSNEAKKEVGRDGDFPQELLPDPERRCLSNKEFQSFQGFLTDNALKTEPELRAALQICRTDARQPIQRAFREQNKRSMPAFYHLGKSLFEDDRGRKIPGRTGKLR